MRYLNALFLLLVIVGGINWLLVGLFQIDLVAMLTGNTFGQTSLLSSVIYLAVGISALALLPVLARWVGTPSEAAAECTRVTRKLPANVRRMRSTGPPPSICSTAAQAPKRTSAAHGIPSGVSPAASLSTMRPGAEYKEAFRAQGSSNDAGRFMSHLPGRFPLRWARPSP